ncbi:MAG: NAD(P)H-hydrate epimerase [Planctomycetota bacterium]|jgi:NAD(P)H-hydrate epimerase|nr:NAD(P)H-hydrate epimerase [Planctomycetota bacterium]
MPKTTAEIKELLAAERTGRSLAAREAPRKGDLWRFEIRPPPDARLAAAMRWAKRLGAGVETVPGSANRLYLQRDGRQTEIQDFPPPDSAWAPPLSGAGLFIKPADRHSPMLSAALCREVDSRAANLFGVPSICLMENAAVDSVILARDMLGDSGHSGILIAAGGGNNGGDGLAAARGLAGLGLRVEVALLKNPASLAGDAATNLGLLRDVPRVPIHDFHGDPQRLEQLLPGKGLLIDALLGTGLKGGLSPAFAIAIRILNSSGLPILALDLPSGLDADGGVAGESVIRAERTLTFAAVKPGLLEGFGPGMAGRLYLGEIGAPSEAYPETRSSDR